MGAKEGGSWDGGGRRSPGEMEQVAQAAQNVGASRRRRSSADPPSTSHSLPTFSPHSCAPIVLAAQTCIGASFSPLPCAHKFSLDLAEQIRRALAALYEHDLRNLRSEEIMHAGLLVSVFFLRLFVVMGGEGEGSRER